MLIKPLCERKLQEAFAIVGKNGPQSSPFFPLFFLCSCKSCFHRHCFWLTKSTEQRTRQLVSLSFFYCLFWNPAPLERGHKLVMSIGKVFFASPKRPYFVRSKKQRKKEETKATLSQDLAALSKNPCWMLLIAAVCVIFVSCCKSSVYPVA